MGSCVERVHYNKMSCLRRFYSYFLTFTIVVEVRQSDASLGFHVDSEYVTALFAL